MATTQNKLTFKPEILKWVLDTEGYTPEELAKESRIPLDQINNLLMPEHEAWPELVEQIARHFRLSSALFYMSGPPYESRLCYTGIPGTPAGKPSRKTLQAIKQAYHMQSFASEVLRKNDIDDLEPDVERISRQNPATKTARDQRDKLGFESIDAAAPEEKRYAYMYDCLVEKIEKLDIFVHQIPMPIDEARGFILIDGLPRVIAVNAADSDATKIFTLLHEYAHVLLKDGDNVCFPNYSLKGAPGHLTETWCNDFAGSFLMPEEELQKRLKELEETKSDPEQIIAKLARHFYSSGHAVLARMERLGIKTANSALYKNYFEEMKNKEMPPDQGASGSQNQDSEITKCINQRGKKLIHLVLKANDKGLVTSYDVIDYLDLDPDYLDDLEKILRPNHARNRRQ